MAEGKGSAAGRGGQGQSLEAATGKAGRQAGSMQPPHGDGHFVNRNKPGDLNERPLAERRPPAWGPGPSRFRPLAQSHLACVEADGPGRHGAPAAPPLTPQQARLRAASELGFGLQRSTSHRSNRSAGPMGALRHRLGEPRGQCRWRGHPCSHAMECQIQPVPLPPSACAPPQRSPAPHSRPELPPPPVPPAAPR